MQKDEYSKKAFLKHCTKTLSVISKISPIVFTNRDKFLFATSCQMIPNWIAISLWDMAISNDIAGVMSKIPGDLKGS